MEFTREEKIEKLKKLIKTENKNVEYYQKIIDEDKLPKDLKNGGNELIRELSLQVQAYELLLKKLEKGEAK